MGGRGSGRPPGRRGEASSSRNEDDDSTSEFNEEQIPRDEVLQNGRKRANNLLNNDLEYWQGKAKYFQQRNRALEEELEGLLPLKQQYHKNEFEKKEAEDQVRTLETECSRLEKKIQKTKSEVETTSSELDATKKKLNEAKEKLDAEYYEGFCFICAAARSQVFNRTCLCLVTCVKCSESRRSPEGRCIGCSKNTFGGPKFVH